MRGEFTAENVRDFDLRHIFECGQCFRWEREANGSYTGLAKGKIANMKYWREEEKLIIDNCTEEEFEEVWKPYLDLERDYGRIKVRLAADDEIMDRAVEFGSGIRILRQDLWETIVSFIISQNNNIPRIKGCIEKLASLYGKQAGEYRGRVWYNLPEPEVLANLSPKELEPVKLGYRAKYLVSAARTVVAEGLPEDEAQLSSLSGVGPKVAGCIRLFGMSRYDAFPVDVWVARVMNRLYGIDEKDHREMERFARTRFGELGGFAQQYLFYYARENG